MNLPCQYQYRLLRRLVQMYTMITQIRWMKNSCIHHRPYALHDAIPARPRNRPGDQLDENEQALIEFLQRHLLRSSHSFDARLPRNVDEALPVLEEFARSTLTARSFDSLLESLLNRDAKIKREQVVEFIQALETLPDPDNIIRPLILKYQREVDKLSEDVQVKDATQSVRKFAAKLGWCPASMLGGRRRGLAWCCAVVLDDVNVVEPRPPVTTILLDNQKAYDTTERALANEKLLARGVPAHVNVAVVQSQFDGCTFQMMLDRQLSSAIDVLVGVFQRAMLSLLLFNIHIDDLPMFADDTSLYALSDDVAQRMLDHREDYDRRHRFVFNARKPQVTKDPARRGATFTTMEDEIPEEADLASSTKLPSSWEWPSRCFWRVAIGRTGALATKHFSLARKRLLIFIWVRARAEYGLASSDHS
ncbi:unnamed protein product (mitochondrion) [Plasmodiophora brassicae]|uniref:Reverse transcriptase domain-containing protein n=1 Tax=Plasmodiophora brassicae TaxID=37360 RepID=A0A3P3Y7N2_PLABS|nr:unnamed protein product [Plasmodiophora brassicae]